MKKILVIRFSSIGDIVLTSPVIRCLKQQLPEVEVHVLTKESNRQLFDSNPHINKVYSFSEKRSLSEVTALLKKEKYDFVVDLHKNLRSFRVKRALSVWSKSFPKLNFRKYLLVQFKWNIMPEIHIVDRYFEAVKPLGVKNDHEGLDFFIPKHEVFDPESLPLLFRNGYHAVVLGGQHKTKIFPAEKVIEVAQYLEKPIVLLGGPEDAERGEKIVLSLGEKALNKCGKLSLFQSALIVKNALSVLTNDTGLMHIAAAFRKNTVSVWGNTVPELGMYPYMPGDEKRSVIIEIKPLKCRPCSKIGFKECPKGHFKCMNDHYSKKIAQELLFFGKEI
ncbi:MAG: glycosyltransferase family 9 protein [Bacteroidetes bacterium]|nr:glycosyltransferase family 9 protein [Bacteroidota bacterium]